MMEKTLKEIMPEGSYNGFLASIGTSGPWEEDVSAEDLARLDQYFLNGHSGGKPAAPLMQMYLDSETGKMTSTTVAEAAAMALAIWKQKWTRLWEVFIAEYNPIENYNMVEDGTETPTGKEVMDRTHQGSNTTRTAGAAADNVTENTVYGFNSVTGQPSAKQSQKSDVTVTHTPGASDKEEKSFVNRVDTHHLTRSGNIGVTTTQQMIQSTITLENSWNFWLQVMADLGNTFCLDCYF